MPIENGEKVETLIGVSRKMQDKLKSLKMEIFNTKRASYLQVLKKLIEVYENNRGGKR